MTRFAVIATIVCTLVTCPAAAETFRVPLLLEDTSGCRVTSRRAERLERVPGANAEGFIVIDGGRPTRAACDAEAFGVAEPSSGALADKTSSCACRSAPEGEKAPPSPAPARCNFLRYDFHVREPGTYAVIVRVAVPPGRFSFVETLDGRRYSGPQREENSGPEPVTRWVARPKVRLGPGLHRLCLAASGYPVPGVLAIVLGPPSAPLPSADPPAAALADVDPRALRTMPLHVPGLVAVKAVHGAGADLLRRSAAGEPVRFHFTLDAAHPALGPLTAEVEVAAGAVIRLEQGAAELLLDGRTGGFLMLYDRAADRLLAGGGPPQSMLAVQFKKAGEARWTQVDPEGVSVCAQKKLHALGPWHLEPVSSESRAVAPERIAVEGGKTVVRHVLAAEGLGRARVTQTIAPAGDRAWRLAAEVESLEGPADVVGLAYPRLPAVRIGQSGLDDVQLRMMSFGHRRVQPGREPLHDASYCGRVVMNWTQVYDAEASLYLGVHDPAGTTTVHASEPAGPDGEAVGLLTRRLDEIRPGTKILWETCLAVGQGGWHSGARLYGDWFTAAHGPADYPAWLKSSLGWLDVQAENAPGFRFERLEDWLTLAHAVGLDWLQVWGQFGYDWGPCCSAWYGLSPQYGGVEGWRAATSAIRRRGGHVGGYFIYDRFDRLPVELNTFLGRFEPKDYSRAEPWDDAEFQREIAAVVDPSGGAPLPASAEELASYRAQVAEHRKLSAEGRRAPPVQWWQTAYLPDPRWRDYLASWIADRYAGAWGANTCYIDVLGTGNATVDYDLRRGNNGDGSWGLGRKLLAREVLQRARRHDPAFGLTMEGLGDLPGLCAAAMCSGVYLGHRNVVRYTFPDRILIHGMANSGGHGTGGPLTRYLATFREAMRWDIVGRPTALPVSLLNLTRPFLPELYQARFLDTDGLHVSDPRIEARRFDATRTALGCHVITATNPQRVDGEIRLTDPDLCRSGAVMGLALDGRVLKSASPPGAEAVRLDMDRTVPAALWLAPAPDRPDAPAWPVLWVDWSRASRNEPVTLLLFNLAGRARRVAAEVRCLGYTEPFAERLPAEARVALRRDVSLAPCEAAAVRLRSPGTAVAAWGNWTTRWTVSLSGQVREHLLTPLVLDPSFDLQSDGGALELGPSTEGFQHRVVDLWLLPATRYRLRVQAKRTGFQAAVSGTLLRLGRGDADEYDDHRWGIDRTRPNEWQSLGGEFTTPPDLTRASVYLYNVRSPDTAWFDDLFVEQRTAAGWPSPQQLD